MKDKQEVPESPAEQEVRRLMDVLRTLIRLLGHTHREIERRGHLSHATALRVFQGHSEPRLDFLLAAVQAMGLEYAEFFAFAYAPPCRPSEAAQKLRSMLEHLQAGPARFLGPAQAEEAASVHRPQHSE